MEIDIRKLIKGDVDVVDFEYETDAPEELSDVSFDGKMHLCGKVRNMAGYMTVGASAEIPFTTHCARCFKEIKRTYKFDFEKPIAVKGSLSDEESEEDYIKLEKGILDPDDAIREAVLLDFPMIFLCDENCKGLCPKCGADLNEGECGCPKKEIDPRLAILGKLLDK